MGGKASGIVCADAPRSTKNANSRYPRVFSTAAVLLGALILTSAFNAPARAGNPQPARPAASAQISIDEGCLNDFIRTRYIIEGNTPVKDKDAIHLSAFREALQANPRLFKAFQRYCENKNAAELFEAFWYIFPSHNPNLRHLEKE